MSNVKTCSRFAKSGYVRKDRISFHERGEPGRWYEQQEGVLYLLIRYACCLCFFDMRLQGPSMIARSGDCDFYFPAGLLI